MNVNSSGWGEGLEQVFTCMRRNRRHQRAHARLNLEELGERLVPSTGTYDAITTTDNTTALVSNAGSLRACILAADTDTVNSVEDIVLTSGSTYSLTIANPGGHSNSGTTGNLVVANTAS